MRHYILDTTDDSVKYHLDQFVDDETGYDVYRLSYSNSNDWHTPVRGQNILTVTNDGNGFKIKWQEKLEKHYLNYSQMRELQLVLTFIQTTDPLDNNVMILKHDELVRL
jgi:hypothetical protein